MAIVFFVSKTENVARMCYTAACPANNDLQMLITVNASNKFTHINILQCERMLIKIGS